MKVAVQLFVGAGMEDDMGLHETLATCHPSLTRGQVWCKQKQEKTTDENTTTKTHV